MLRTSYVGRELIHRHLWEIVAEESQRAARSERGWRKPSLVAMVFAFHAVEAYLNFAGEHLAPDVWKNEREFFRKVPYRGFEGKLRKVLELVDIQWQPDKRPLTTILELKRLRDLIAHGASERLSGELSHGHDWEPPFPTSTIVGLVTPKERLPAVLPDVEALLQDIHSRVPTKVAVDPWFGPHPLLGPVTYTAGSTRLED